MTLSTLKKLPEGIQVGWDNDPAARGQVVKPTGRPPYILWADGQQTEGFDDWALQHVVVLTKERVAKIPTPETHSTGEEKEG